MSIGLFQCKREARAGNGLPVTWPSSPNEPAEYSKYIGGEKDGCMSVNAVGFIPFPTSHEVYLSVIIIEAHLFSWGINSCLIFLIPCRMISGRKSIATTTNKPQFVWSESASTQTKKNDCYMRESQIPVFIKLQWKCRESRMIFKAIKDLLYSECEFQYVQWTKETLLSFQKCPFALLVLHKEHYNSTTIGFAESFLPKLCLTNQSWAFLAFFGPPCAVNSWLRDMFYSPKVKRVNDFPRQ